MSQPAAPVLTPLMRVFCAWCKKELAPKPVAEPTDRASHGCCQECKVKVLAEIEETRKAEAQRMAERARKSVLA